MSASCAVALRQTPNRTVPCIYELDPCKDSRWNTLVENHPRASVFHSSNWLRVLQAVYGYQPVAFTSCGPGNALTNGLVFCYINSRLTGRRFVSLPFSDHCEPLVDRADELDEMLVRVNERAYENKAKYIEIRPVLLTPGTNSGLTKSRTYRSHRLDLQRSTDTLFHNFHKDCVQRKIRRAEREGLKYEVGNSERLLQMFFQLFVKTRRRQRLPPQPLAWFQGLASAFGDDLEIHIASKSDVPLAGIMTLCHKKSITYKYGGSDASLHRVGGMALLLWNTIREAKEKGLHELDLGRSDLTNQGLIAFKEHWGAAGSSLSYWTHPQRQEMDASRWQNSVAGRIASHAPEIALRTAGALLYGHIG